MVKPDNTLASQMVIGNNQIAKGNKMAICWHGTINATTDTQHTDATTLT